MNDKEINKVFEDCFRQFFKPLCYYAMGFVKDGEAAKDLVHDAFLSAWTHRHEIDFSLPMYPYFLNLTRNNAINYLEHCEVRARHAASEMKKGEAFEMPALDNHEELIAKILDTISAAKDYLFQHDFTLQDLIDAKDFEKTRYLLSGAESVSGSMEERKQFQTYASELIRMMKYADREDVSELARKEFEAIEAIYYQMQKKRKSASNTDLMVEINSIISEYVQVDAPGEGIVPSRQFDISKIDFDLLRREFARAKKKNLILKDLDDLIQERLDKLLFSNPQRINYYERYQQIIEDYNSEQNRATIEKTFMDLMDLANSMDQEEQRYVREGFSSDEELSLYDLLFSENLSKQDIQKIKQVAVDLLTKGKAKIAELDHWTDKQETKAAVDNLIRDTLWAELPECYDEVSISGYRQKIYEYVYTRYPDVA